MKNLPRGWALAFLLATLTPIAFPLSSWGENLVRTERLAARYGSTHPQYGFAFLLDPQPREVEFPRPMIATRRVLWPETLATSFLMLGFGVVAFLTLGTRADTRPVPPLSGAQLAGCLAAVKLEASITKLSPPRKSAQEIWAAMTGITKFLVGAWLALQRYPEAQLKAAANAFVQGLEQTSARRSTRLLQVGVVEPVGRASVEPYKPALSDVIRSCRSGSISASDLLPVARQLAAEHQDVSEDLLAASIANAFSTIVDAAD